MARKDGSLNSNNTFEGGINTDIQDFHSSNKSYLSARNATDNSVIGDLGNIKNEPANQFCTSAPYTIIGTIHLENTQWVIFSTDNINSEIGLFDEKDCSYTKIVNDSCLNFSDSYLISGASRPTFDCSYRIYWQDNLNPDRSLDIQDVPWIQECDIINDCEFCTDTEDLDCNKILLESIIQQPCVTLERGPSGGNILNGSYYVQIAYAVNGQRVTDYFLPSNILSLFQHGNINTSIIINVDNLDENFDEYEVVVIQQIAEKISARSLGLYSTGQNKITVDFVDPTLTSVKLGDLLITNPIAERSEGIFSVGSYLFRTGISGKFDFNYQTWANQIRTKWQTIEYPHYYYRDGGSNVGYMRDEVYSFFIRWVYNTGDKSRSYHIPGRAPQSYTAPDGTGTYIEDGLYTTVNDNNIEDLQGTVPYVFEMFNTANGTTITPTTLPDGGIVTAEGQMGYWQSEEIYPNDNFEVWGDLCGKPIRHHKFPENTLYEGNGSSTITNHYTQNTIRVLGVKFENILPPVDNNGNVITNIIGYEILRGSRDGNRTVLYKGLINNMREYEIPKEVIIGRQGLYPNYPFNSLLPDPFNSTTEVTYETFGGLTNYNPNPNYSQNHFTFHSPDTMFNKPFLSMKELKIYGAMYGEAECNYSEVRNHPKHVFVTDLTFWVSVVFGLGVAITKAVGDKTYTKPAPEYYKYPVMAGSSSTTPGFNGAGLSVLTGDLSGTELADLTNEEISGLIAALTGVNVTEESLSGVAAGSNAANALLPGTGVTTKGIDITYSGKRNIPTLIKAVLAFPTFSSDLAEGSDALINLIRNVSKKRNFATQFFGYCGYENFASPYTTNRRRLINEANYLDSQLQNFLTTHRINNVLRPKTVVLDTTVDSDPTIIVEDLIGNLADNTFQNILLSDQPDGNKPFEIFTRRASSHYVALKTRLRNQYGQLNNIRQLPATYCTLQYTGTTTDSTTIFGGDTYIGRYQEKNTFYHFYRWLYDLPDFTEWNYHLYDAVQHTAFWMDTEPFDIMEFVRSIGTALQTAIDNGSNAIQTFFQNLVTPSDKHCFDRLLGTNNQPSLNDGNGIFTVKNAYMYLFHSSVRDFFVETELNIDHRDYLDNNAGKHWDALQNLQEMFDPSIIEAGNVYKLDRSLSINELPYTKVSWSLIQDKDYNPTLAETCYTDYPLRLLYSLPQELSLKQDNWSVFLANNYKDFRSKVVSIKAIQRTGILLLFQNDSPGIYPGVDELQLRSGTSITVGDGGLFTREMQRLANSDQEYEYGSAQNRRAIVNTPVGIFYISQEQGKIFSLAGGIQEITITNNEFWFNSYLPYQIIQDFPDFDLLDNPVKGVGCQVIYDNEYRTLYFCKKDYKLKDKYKGELTYIGNGEFDYRGWLKVTLDNKEFFESASWTVSYDPATGNDISWHDWHPNLAMGAKNTFMTIVDQSIWKHNNRCDLYCNFYNQDYPFEIEFKVDTTPGVTTIRNIEYYMEVFQYNENCRDRFHVLDFNFDEAVIYNSEQTSGLLSLNLSPKNNSLLLASYPIVGFNQIDILYSKEEQKYRFNQFWDVTRNRGEFSPTVTESIWNTEPNGYIKNLNPVNLNYTKNELQRKKFRHYDTRVLLRRTVSGNKNMQLLLTDLKHQLSFR